MAQPPITALLRELGAKDVTDPEASGRLFQAVYRELRRMAAGLMRRERRGHTLEPTALVHEAYLRLVGQAGGVPWDDRRHFFGVAARVMRQVLVDHARRRGAARRGGGSLRVTLDIGLARGTPGPTRILDLHEALESLAALDPRGAQVVELKVFAGLTTAEIGALLDVSKRTVDDDWSMAKMWLRRRLGAGRAR